MKHVMLDIETMGTSADAAILTVGLAHFDINTGEIIKRTEFRNPQASQEAIGRRIDPGTVKWWSGQSPEARARLTEPPLYEPVEMMTRVHQWLSQVCRSQWDLAIWAKGPNFDMMLCRHLCAQINVKWKGHFSREYCVRTMLAIAKAKGWHDILEMENELAHGAEADAVYQAQQVAAVWGRIK